MSRNSPLTLFLFADIGAPDVAAEKVGSTRPIVSALNTDGPEWPLHNGPYFASQARLNR
jgi:hypothetical protein